ncbi:jg11017 [Pararge aegeria aegeria]|uniref:Jg11017 protein n=1 Tax=Pararge aegeria aegeria TaxID=348720 RepID=A0A8S4SB43_9NEOP|nr:jg11017 [Pararge aegeria aegeria]
MPSKRNGNAGRGKRFTFQSTVRQVERRKIAEKLSREADLKEQQRRTELEAMRRVEEEFQRKRAREKASIRQQLRLVSSGANSMPPVTHHNKTRDEPDGSCRDSPTAERTRDARQRHSNTSSEASGRSKSTTPQWKAPRSAAARAPTTTGWSSRAAAPPARRARPARRACCPPRARPPPPPAAPSCRCDSPSRSGGDSSSCYLKLTYRREPTKEEDADEPAIVPTLRPSGPARPAVATR